MTMAKRTAKKKSARSVTGFNSWQPSRSTAWSGPRSAVLMARVSSDEQAKGYSLDIQEEALRAYCSREGILVSTLFREDHSAKDFNRPEWSKMMAYLKKHRADVNLLLVTSWDRFSRNLTDALIELRKLHEMGIEVCAIEQPLDLSIPESKAMLALYLAIPEIDNDRRSMKIRGGMRAALKDGRWCRVAPRGYRNSRDPLNKPIIVPDKTTSKAVKHIFELASEGIPQAQLLLEAEDLGLKLSRNGLSKMLRNPVYCGKILVPEEGDEPEVIIEGKHKGIVPESTFDRVQELLAGRKSGPQVRTYNNLDDEMPLRGVLSCSKCGGNLTGSRSKSKSGKRHAYYHCNHCRKERHPVAKANDHMARLLSQFKFKKSTKALYNAAVEALLGESKEKRIQSKRLASASIKKHEARLAKLQDLLADGNIDLESYQSMSKRYKKALHQAHESQRQSAESQGEKTTIVEHRFNLLENLGNIVHQGDTKSIQRAIRTIFPDGVSFDGNQCRTPRLDEVLRYSLLVDNDCEAVFAGKQGEILKKSLWVEPGGVEPPSKQGHTGVSTCLSRD